MVDTAFELLRRHPIPSLRVELQDYRHRATGARHIHLASDDPHNVFLVAFLTVPQDSTGVAHILEHTALCGSRRYPVRDPFFMMIRRSLHTFMNAFTSADWTAYPFASQNKKDFNNLLDVYLDAAFFPLLNELDFAQEGWRLEFGEPDNSDFPLVFKGVVYNEMKGVLSSPVSRLHQALQSVLYPTTTYHHNSGGDPAHIPDLRYADLKAFHARHYHPSNALFLTYGDIPAAEHQQRFHDRVLQQFERQALDFSIPDERRYQEPQSLTAYYPLAGEDDTQRRTHIVLGWLLGRNSDPRAMLETQLLSDILLDNSSSPLRHALETSSLGTAPSPLCGFDDDFRETAFVCGLEGSEPEHAEAVEQLILDTLQRVAKDGVPPETVEAMLHQLELSQREITGDGFPYGLQLLLDALTPAIHGGDPVATLDLDPHLEQLRADCRDPDFIKGLVRRLLLDNRHRVRLVMAPDPALGEREAAAEQARLAERRATLDAADCRFLVERARALQQRQNQADDPELLPRVTLADVAPELTIPRGESRPLGALPTTWYTRGTNGMAYAQLIAELPRLNGSLHDLLPLYALCLPEVGCNGHDYLTQQARQAAAVGGLSAGCLVRNPIAEPTAIKGLLTLASKALARKHGELAELMQETFSQARFDELPRLRELVAQLRAQREAAVTRSGHTLAMIAASSGLSPITALAHRWDGLLGLQALRTLDRQLVDDTELAAFGERLTAIHGELQSTPRQLLVVSETEAQADLTASLGGRLAGLDAARPSEPFTANILEQPFNQGWSTSTQVNFCAAAWPTVPPDHADAPALMVLGEFLRNGYLHRAIREQGGAYGAGAGYHGDSGTFRMFSYRDPRLVETFADFQSALDWLTQANHEPRTLEEAILGVVAAIDKPGSPAGEAISAYFAGLFGRTPEWRQHFRRQVLGIGLADLQRVAAEYLSPDQMRRAAIGSAATLRTLEDWTIHSL